MAGRPRKTKEELLRSNRERVAKWRRRHRIGEPKTDEQAERTSQLEIILGRLENKVDALKNTLDARIDALENKMDARFNVLDAKFNKGSSETQGSSETKRMAGKVSFHEPLNQHGGGTNQIPALFPPGDRRKSINLQELAELSGMAVPTLRDWLRRGKIKGAYQLSGKHGMWRFRREMLEQWWEELLSDRADR